MADSIKDVSDSKPVPEAESLSNAQIADIVHDLNNLLTPMTMTVKLLRKDRPAQEREGLLNTLQASVDRARELIKQLQARTDVAG